MDLATSNVKLKVGEGMFDGPCLKKSVDAFNSVMFNVWK